MNISGITRFSAAAVPVIQLNDAGGSTALNRQLLKGVLLADQLGSEIASVRKQHQQYQQSPTSIDHQLVNFWQDKPGLVTFEELGPLEQIQYDYDSDSRFLQSKAEKLTAQIEKMPAGPEKDATQQKVASFLRSNTDRLAAAYHQGMAHATCSIPRDSFAGNHLRPIEAGTAASIRPPDLSQLNQLKELLASNTSSR